jgi:DNA phosphorothioation-associated putative methyltransferase
MSAKSGGNAQLGAIGKHVSGKHYVHISVLPLLSERDQALTRQAIDTSGLVADRDFNVIRVTDDGDEVALLAYPGFFEEPFPALAASWRFDSASKRLMFRDYSQSLNPPILHRKELLIAPDHPDHARFVALTQAAEALGLFDDPTRIGYRNLWIDLIRSKGYDLQSGEFIPIGNDNTGDAWIEPLDRLITVQRHRTALSRTALSAPMQSLIRYGLVRSNTTVFDYGCGKGSDLEGLTALGIHASGWDPFFRPNDPIAEADVVNLGFVINVIEDFDERVAALQGAFRLARHLIAVSAMLSHSAPQAARCYRDGVLSSRDTFQKYYRQEELQQFIESVLDEEAVPVAQGIFYVFKDSDAEQRFLLSRSSSADRVSRSASLEWRRPRQPSLPRTRLPKAVVEDQVATALCDQLWTMYVELGRPPEENELENSTELVAKFGSLSRARRETLRGHDGSVLQSATKARTDDVAVMLALHMFSKRRQFRSLGQRLQRDIKAFFGSLSRAEDRARALLFSVSDVRQLEVACTEAASLGLGWLEPGHSLQLHTSQASRLPPILRVYLGCATALFGDLGNVDLVKLHIQSGKVTLMRFDDFGTSPLPVMRERIKIRLRDQEMDIFTYGVAFAPPLLFFKSHFVNEEFPNFPEQVAFEKKLEELKLFNLSGYGPPATAFWEDLGRARWTIEGLSFKRATNIPELDDRCGQRFTFRDLVECSDTWKKTRIDNSPRSAESYNALADLTRFILDPVVDYYGAIKLTYGFCSRRLGKLILKGVAPELDQHAAYELTRTGRFVCNRGGAAVDFVVQDEDMTGVAEWIVQNLPFDRLYFYGADRPIHISYGPEQKGDFITVREHAGRRVPSAPRRSRGTSN